MPLISYTPKEFNLQHEAIVVRANEIIGEYAAAGYDLTLRQLYYQFVSRDLFPASWADKTTGSTNNEKSYKKLGNIVSDARRAGRIDWDRIVDRTRFVRNPPNWANPAAVVGACADQFDVDWWANQKYRPEVWIEKDALIGVLEVACAEWHCPYFSCRGYPSDSEVWQAAQRMDRHCKKGQKPILFHLGDHDPSGIDMTRDITDRLKMFLRRPGLPEVRRLALNMSQVEEHEPPPNPAKSTDSRFADYSSNYGDESWELDALPPNVLAELIATEMNEIIDQNEWSESEARRDEGREQLRRVSTDWDSIIAAQE